MDFNQKLEVLENKMIEIKSKIQDIQKLVENYSIFDAKQIGEFLADFMSIEDTQVEENFTYNEGWYYLKKFGDKRYVKFLLSSIATKEEIDKLYVRKRDGKINYSIFADLAVDDKIIILYKDPTPRNIIKFYNFHNQSYMLIKDDFEKINCIKNFIDYVISYRIENKVENITEEELNKLKDEFISLKIEESKSSNENQFQKIKLKFDNN